MTATPDLKRAFDALSAKRLRYDEYYRYYDGQHPLRYTTDRLKEAFRDIKVYFAQNWVAVVIDAVLDRLILKGFDLSDDETTKDKLETLWDKLHISLEADDVHEAASLTGEGFIIVGKNEDGTLNVVANDPRMCHVFYDESNPREKAFACKMWRDKVTQFYMMNLYYPDRIEHYATNTRNMPGSANAFQPVEGDPSEAPDIAGTVPVFHFRRGRRLKGELTLADYSLQDAVNKTFADMMVASEFTAFKQRVIISQVDPGNLPNAPDRNWWIPAGDGVGQQASVQEIGGGGQEAFLKTMGDLANSMAIITRTPKHYFFGTGGDPSGDALVAMEAPLVKKVVKRQEAYGVTWAELAAYLLQLDAGTTIDPTELTPVWETPETIQPGAEATTIQTLVNATVPLKTALRRAGWDAADLKQMEDDKAEEQKNKNRIAKDAIDAARKNAEQNPNPAGGPQGDPNSTMPPGMNTGMTNAQGNQAVSK